MSNRFDKYKIPSVNLKANKVDGFKTNLKDLDNLLGHIPYPCVIEVYGESAVGKSTFILSWFHKREVMWVTLDGTYNNPLKIDEEGIVTVSMGPDLALLKDVIYTGIKGGMRHVVIDNIAAFSPEDFDSITYEEIISMCSTHKIILIFINQIRNNFKQIVSYGSPGLRTSTDIKIKVLRKSIKRNTIEMQITKNRFGGLLSSVKINIVPPNNEEKDK